MQPREPALRLCLIGAGSIFDLLKCGREGPAPSIFSFGFEDVISLQCLPAKGFGRLAAAAAASDAVLIAWQSWRAPLVGALRQNLWMLDGPIIACGDASATDEEIAITIGADFYLRSGASVKMLRAQLDVYRRIRWAANDRNAYGAASHANEAVIGKKISSDTPVAPATQLGHVKFDRAGHRLFIRNQEVILPQRQYALLEYLIRHPGRLVHREKIMDEVWNLPIENDPRMTNAHVCRLRKVLRNHAAGVAIETERGLGYRLLSHTN